MEEYWNFAIVKRIITFANEVCISVGEGSLKWNEISLFIEWLKVSYLLNDWKLVKLNENSFPCYRLFHQLQVRFCIQLNEFNFPTKIPHTSYEKRFISRPTIWAKSWTVENWNFICCFGSADEFIDSVKVALVALAQLSPEKSHRVGKLCWKTPVSMENSFNYKSELWLTSIQLLYGKKGFNSSEKHLWSKRWNFEVVHIDGQSSHVCESEGRAVREGEVYKCEDENWTGIAQRKRTRTWKYVLQSCLHLKTI